MHVVTFLVFFLVTAIASTIAGVSDIEHPRSELNGGSRVKRAVVPVCEGSSITLKDDFYNKDTEGVESSVLCPAGMPDGELNPLVITDTKYRMRSTGPKVFAVFKGVNGTSINGFKFRISSTMCDCGQYIRPKKFSQSCGFEGPGTTTAVETGGNCTHFWKSPPASFLKLQVENFKSKSVGAGCDGARMKTSLDNQMKTANSHCGDTMPTFSGIKKVLINSYSSVGDIRIKGKSINANGADTYDATFQTNCLCGLMSLPEMTVIPERTKRNSGDDVPGEIVKRAIPQETCFLTILEVYNPIYQKGKQCLASIIGRKALLTSASCVEADDTITSVHINQVTYDFKGFTTTDGSVTVVHLTDALDLRREGNAELPTCSICLPCSENTATSIGMEGLAIQRLLFETEGKSYLGKIANCDPCRTVEDDKLCFQADNPEQLVAGSPLVAKIKRKGYADHYVLTGMMSQPTCKFPVTLPRNDVYVKIHDSIPFIMAETTKYGAACVPKVMGTVKRSVAEEFLDNIGV